MASSKQAELYVAAAFAWEAVRGLYRPAPWSERMSDAARQQYLANALVLLTRAAREAQIPLPDHL